MSAGIKRRSGAFSVGLGVSKLRDFGVGKWSRIAKYGVRTQGQPDGSSRTFNFDDKAFAEGLKNFRRMYAGRGRGMGSDWEHQTLNASLNGQPAPSLAFFTAMAVIDQSGRVSGFEDLRGDAVPIDPAAERARLAAQHPLEDPDPAGTWVYCSEVTPLGELYIPCYSDLSPLFNDADVDEQEKPVGFAWQNVSFVNISFQTGTSFNFGKGILTMNLTPEMMAKLGKFGFSADKPESVHDAYHAYMAGTPDSPEERAKVAEAYKKMGKMAAEPPGGSAPAASTPEPPAPGAMGTQLDPVVAAMQKRVAAAETLLAQFRDEHETRNKKEYGVRLAAFRKEMLEGETARFLPTQEADLDRLIGDVGGDLDKARAHAQLIPPVAAFKRWTQGGNPVGTTSVPPPGISGMSRQGKGFAFNKAVRELRTKEPSLSFEEAQQRIANEQPDLYSGSF